MGLYRCRIKDLCNFGKAAVECTECVNDQVPHHALHYNMVCGSMCLAQYTLCIVNLVNKV